MSQPPHYAPPAGSPPAPSYRPPPGRPPPASGPPLSLPPPPIACPIPLASHRASANQTNTPDEPLPPYTAKSTDPLPTWAQSGSPRFIDLTHNTPNTSPPHLPLDPPPECFSTPSPPRIRSASFAPFRIPSRERNLAGGFVLLWAPDELVHHGIAQGDWTRFLLDLGTTARMAAQGLSVRGGAVTATGGVGAGGGRLLQLAVGNRGTVYDAAFVKTPVEEVQSLVNVWNESALVRRKVRVSLHPKVDAGGRQKEGYDLLVEAL